MIFSKIIAGYCENHGNHTNAVCAKCRYLNVVVHMFTAVLCVNVVVHMFTAVLYVNGQTTFFALKWCERSI
jgi:hypothetical protein